MLVLRGWTKLSNEVLKMLQPTGKNKSETGFCWGQYATVLEGVSRIRIGRDIIRGFKEHKVDVLWLYISPSYPAIVLCPESCREAYIVETKTHFPPTMDPEIAYRKYIGTGRSARYDKQGRVYLPVFCLEHAGIKLEEEVIIIGVGMWYEIWAPKRWEACSS